MSNTTGAGFGDLLSQQKPEPISAISLPHPTPHEQLAQVWEQHQDNPQQQALLSTTYCLTHTPHLAAWLKEKIYASLPDRLLKEMLTPSPLRGGMGRGADGRPTGTSDGRLVALCLLAEATTVSSPAKRGRPGGGFAPRLAFVAEGL